MCATALATYRADERTDVPVTLDDGEEADGELRAWKSGPTVGSARFSGPWPRVWHPH